MMVMVMMMMMYSEINYNIGVCKKYFIAMRLGLRPVQASVKIETETAAMRGTQ
jgi:hypothetical protein